ncbi:MAG: Rieske 2Fe-2S domain-containing protein [Chthoniobacteraceae bacterium]
MSRLDFWHPIMASRDVPRDRPVGVSLDGKRLALFRAGDGRFGALEDKCAHRRMKLSTGRVDDGRVICPYHGWSFASTGEGESPSAPKMHACAASYDCAETSGVVWVRARENQQALPTLVKDGWNAFGTVFNRLPAPLQLVIDNFSEIEHTVTTHPHFGFEPARASEATIVLETTDDSVIARGYGPAKRPPLGTRLGAGIRRGDLFHADYTFYFDPPRSIVTHWWSDPQTGRERMFKYHVIHYFVPEDEKTTRMVTFGFLKIGWPMLHWLGPHLGWLLRRRTWETVEEDAVLLGNLAEYLPGLEGMKLSRFDTILGLTRERLARIYDGV